VASHPAPGSAGPDRPAAVWARAYGVLGHVGGVILAIMAAAVFLQVASRFFTSLAIDGIDEVPRYLFVWLVVIGSAAAMQRNEHTVLDYFVNRLPPRGRALMSFVVNAAGIAFFLYMIKLSLVLVPNAQLQSSPGLDLPLSWVFLAVPVGSFLIILPMVRACLAALRTLWPRPS
jgi:TRAP-type C4-dicarboxylate transport system permease small subunit